MDLQIELVTVPGCGHCSIVKVALANEIVAAAGISVSHRQVGLEEADRMRREEAVVGFPLLILQENGRAVARRSGMAGASPADIAGRLVQWAQTSRMASESPPP